MTKITIGSRGSKLSLTYATKVKDLIIENNDKFEEKDIRLKIIKTSGDKNQNIKLSEIGGKNLFCKEIEEKLLSDDIDIAVHSLKDMDSSYRDELMIGAYLKRNDPRDAIVSHKINNIEDIKDGVTIGSSSRRRELQLKSLNKKIKIINIRGNIDTRINKLEEKDYDAIILAAAGVKCLNLQNKISFIFNIKQVMPAIGQGIIAVQCKKNNDFVKGLLEKINDKETSDCALAERSLLKSINGNCNTAIGALAEIDNNILSLKAQLFSDDGNESFYFEKKGPYSDAVNIGADVGQQLLRIAGAKFKKK